MNDKLDAFFDDDDDCNEEKNHSEYCDFLLDLVSELSLDDSSFLPNIGKDKIMAILVYFFTKTSDEKSLIILSKVKSMKESIVFRVKL